VLSFPNSVLVYFLVAAVIIWIVGRLELGLSVDSFGSASVAAIVIALVGGLLAWLLSLLGITIGSGLLGAIISLFVSALVLMFSDRFLRGMKVKGFPSALVAALGIGMVGWLINWLLSLLGIG
jgi:putative membrane protein